MDQVSHMSILLVFQPPSMAALTVALVTALVVPASRSEDDLMVEEPVALQPQAEQQQLVDLGANFDANLFEQQGSGWVMRGDNGLQFQGRLIVNGRGIGRPAVASDEVRPPESPTFARLRALTEKHLTRIDDACELDDRQRHKLRLAIESDIRRVTEDVDVIRRRYVGVRVNFNDQQGQKQWHQFQQDVQQCRLRLRPILMTSLAFILGVVPLVVAEGAGAEMRRTLGLAVFSGMLGVTLFGIFLTPVFFVTLLRLGQPR